MIAACLAASGAWIGNTTPGNDSNPKGFYEHVALSELLIKPMLSSLGCDPLGVAQLPPLLTPKLEGLTQKILGIIESDGYAQNRRWMFKDAKLTLLWPTFYQAFPQADFIIVRRNANSIINSCLDTDFMRQHSSQESFWEQFVANYMRRMDYLKYSTANWHEIWVDDALDGDLSALRALATALGLDYVESAVSSIIDPTLATHRRHNSPETVRQPADYQAVKHIRHYRHATALRLPHSVAIVGNSNILAENPKGEQIDAHDWVFRFNRAPVTEQTIAFTGGKTSCVVLGPNVSTRQHQDNLEGRQKLQQLCQAESVICYPGHFINLLPYNRNTYQLELDIRSINRVFSDRLGYQWSGFNGSLHPRSGIILLASLLECGLHPHLYGFDFEEGTGGGQYFEETQRTAGETQGHDPVLERVLVSELAARNHVSIH